MAQLDSENDCYDAVEDSVSSKNKKNGWNITLRIIPALVLSAWGIIAFFAGWEISIKTFELVFLFFSGLVILWAWTIKDDGGLTILLVVLSMLVGVFITTETPVFFVDTQGNLVRMVNRKVDTFASIKYFKHEAIGKMRVYDTFHVSRRFFISTGEMVCVSISGRYPFENLQVGDRVPLASDGESFEPVINTRTALENAPLSFNGSGIPSAQPRQELLAWIEGVVMAQGLVRTDLFYAFVPSERVRQEDELPGCAQLIQYTRVQQASVGMGSLTDR